MTPHLRYPAAGEIEFATLLLCWHEAAPLHSVLQPALDLAGARLDFIEFTSKRLEELQKEQLCVDLRMPDRQGEVAMVEIPESDGSVPIKQFKVRGSDKQSRS